MIALEAAAKKLEDGKTFQKLSSSAGNVRRPTRNPDKKNGEKVLEERRLVNGGPRGDRTRDTVIKSHVLYH